MTNNPDAKSLDFVDYDDRGEQGRIERITFNNPAKRNAPGLVGKERCSG